MANSDSVQSMTGFGSAEKGVFRVEIRSLNHRFLEMAVRMPGVLARNEMAVRDMLKAAFGRGKVDVFVTLTGTGQVVTTINESAARNLHAELSALAGKLGIAGGVTMETLVAWKDLFMESHESHDAAPLLEACGEAVQSLLTMRLTEGRGLASEILGILGRIEALNDDIDCLCPSIMSECRDKFLERFRGLLCDGNMDEGRIMQEASQLVEKADITEEITRIRSHVSQMRSVLSEGGTIGRKLDFLLQELNREVNTIASKSGDTRVLRNAIEMKSEIERAREQANNIQ